MVATGTKTVTTCGSSHQRGRHDLGDNDDQSHQANNRPVPPRGQRGFHGVSRTYRPGAASTLSGLTTLTGGMVRGGLMDGSLDRDIIMITLTA
jgi:hypothetical protein